MPEPFLFRKVLYLVEASGKRARNLDELLRLVTVIDPSSVGFHMHREFITYKFAHAEYPNDFAYWAARVLGDEILGERLAYLRVFKYPTLAELSREIAAIIAQHLMAYPETTAERAPRGREFNFCMARKFVMETGRSARNLPEFTGAIAEIEASSLYYHLFETRFGGGEPGRRNDFATWALLSLKHPALADRLDSIDPYMFSIEQARRVLLRILSEAQAEGA
ncbi:MAG: hypothetical protein HY698_10460 [Deltaproteobacteria bacterium]|nr:hypothetical protein [Deltaproteobacteria bacterium]